MIYFIRMIVTDSAGSPVDQFMKIGFTDGEPEERLKAFQTGCPFKMYLCASIEGSERDEKRWHHRFWRDRVRLKGRGREWFRATTQLDQAISSAMCLSSSMPPELAAINPPIETVLAFTLPPLPYDRVNERIDYTQLRMNITDIIYAQTRKQLEDFMEKLKQQNGRLF